MSAERELLKRLVALFDEDGYWSAALDASQPVIADARALLAQPEAEVVWAEGCASFYAPNKNTWTVFVEDACRKSDRGYHERERHVLVRIPVPQHLLNPPVVTGEVVDGN